MERVAMSSRKTLELALRFLHEGKTVVVPTDTVYGLLADATNPEAIERAYLVKGREKGKPFPVFIKDIAEAKKNAEVSPKQEEQLKKAWPGKITFVLKRKDSEGTIGLRVPGHPFLAELLEKAGVPLVGTSANVSGLPASTNIKEVLEQFKGRAEQPDLVLDAGNLPPSRPSRIVDLTGAEPRVLRA
ncbi:MAG: L-threonylcarbamoyladenylate synthase [Patescibacteria group bacterium]